VLAAMERARLDPALMKNNAPVARAREKSAPNAETKFF